MDPKLLCPFIPGKFTISDANAVASARLPLFGLGTCNEGFPRLRLGPRGALQTNLTESSSCMRSSVIFDGIPCLNLLYDTISI